MGLRTRGMEVPCKFQFYSEDQKCVKKSRKLLEKASYVTVLAKSALFTSKLNSILLPQFTDTLNVYPFPVYQVLNANWSAFLKSILPTLQSHGWYNGMLGGCQLDSGELYLLPLAVWPTGALLATVWTS